MLEPVRFSCQYKKEWYVDHAYGQLWYCKFGYMGDYKDHFICQDALDA